MLLLTVTLSKSDLIIVYICYLLALLTRQEKEMKKNLRIRPLRKVCNSRHRLFFCLRA